MSGVERFPYVSDSGDWLTICDRCGKWLYFSKAYIEKPGEEDIVACKRCYQPDRDYDYELREWEPDADSDDPYKRTPPVVEAEDDFTG